MRNMKYNQSYETKIDLFKIKSILLISLFVLCMSNAIMAVYGIQYDLKNISKCEIGYDGTTQDNYSDYVQFALIYDVVFSIIEIMFVVCFIKWIVNTNNIPQSNFYPTWFYITLSILFTMRIFFICLVSVYNRKCVTDTIFNKFSLQKYVTSVLVFIALQLANMFALWCIITYEILCAKCCKQSNELVYIVMPQDNFEDE